MVLLGELSKNNISFDFYTIFLSLLSHIIFLFFKLGYVDLTKNNKSEIQCSQLLCPFNVFYLFLCKLFFLKINDAFILFFFKFNQINIVIYNKAQILNMIKLESINFLIHMKKQFPFMSLY